MNTFEPMIKSVNISTYHHIHSPTHQRDLPSVQRDQDIEQQSLGDKPLKSY